MSSFIITGFADEIDPMLDAQMDELDKHGIKYIEVRGMEGKNISTHSIEEVKALKKRLDARGFKISAVGSPIGKIGINDDFGPQLELFKHVLEIAKIFETRYIRMFSFFIPKDENPAKYRSEVLRRWEAYIEAAKGSGIILVHENEKGIYGDVPERCLDLVQSLGADRIKLVFDPANFIQCKAVPYPDAFKMLKPYIAYMHIKDAVFSDGHVVPAGYGDGRLKDILSELKSGGFEGFLSLEPHLGKFAGFADLEPNSPVNDMPDGGPKKYAMAAESLKKLIGELK